MAYTIEVSNVTGNPYNLPLVLKDTKGNSYIKDIKIPRYALNHKLSFNSEEEFNKLKKDHSSYLGGKEAVIKIGKTNANALEKQNKVIEKENANKIEQDHNSMADKDKEAELEIEVTNQNNHDKDKNKNRK